LRNLIPDIKNDFLILGFTGPLRSGCTTGAEFFSRGQHKTYHELISNNHEKLIHHEYENIGRVKKSIDSGVDLAKSLKNLKQAARTRDVIKILQTHQHHDFRYISMLEVLVKYIFEYLVKNPQQDVKKEYQNVVSIIQGIKVDEEKIFALSNKVEKKEYANLSVDDCLVYDNYLTSVGVAVEKIKVEVPLEVRINAFQDFGDNIRLNGNPLDSETSLIKNCVTLLAKDAKNLIKYYKNREDGKDYNHFVVDAFRNPYEVEYFRYRYYEFYLISVTSDIKTRMTRKNVNSEIDERDSGTKASASDIHKQNVSKCVFLSDIQIDNSENNDNFSSFYKKLLVYSALIQVPGCINPTSDELFMNQAYALSLKSTCISRQVGAVIVGNNGYIVGAGWNDVGAGQIGCGLRRIADVRGADNNDLPLHPHSETNFRELILEKPDDQVFCYKDEYSRYEFRKQMDKFKKSNYEQIKALEVSGDTLDKLVKLQGTAIRIKRLEYCRALHAEENALLQSAKIGGVGVRGGKIYTTYFPCELCAKKIYQSGIEEIVYNEPYPDSVSQDVILKDGIMTIKLTPFEGVKSHSFFRLYKGSLDKKEVQEIMIKGVHSGVGPN